MNNELQSARSGRLCAGLDPSDCSIVPVNQFAAKSGEAGYLIGQSMLCQKLKLKHRRGL